MVRYLSVCSGIEAATVAWHDMGWSPVAFSEIEAFPSAVLRKQYPETPNWGDMTKFQEWPNANVDLLVGGTPCQSFSVAGLRKGLADPRGNLALTYLAIADKYRPRWLVWENVPGVLSSAGGRDFGAFLGGLGQLGYGWAYRVLDAQYFGVAQRRRRVFVVGCLGGWQRAAAVLFERHSLSGHPAPRREAGEEVTRSVGGGPENGSLAGAVTCKWAKGSGGPAGDECYNMIAHAFDARQSNVVQYGDPTGPLLASTGVSRPLPAVAIRTANTGANGHGVALDVAHTLDQAQGQAVAFEQGSIARNAGPSGESDLAPTLRSKFDDNQPAVRMGMAVRRLTVRECERLQGFPDDYTLITYRNKPAADGPRYKTLGNSMAVPVMRWIGRRIQEVDRVER
jgi:DNA (cytosine-5)-methyltransferase 1